MISAASTGFGARGMKRGVDCEGHETVTIGELVGGQSGHDP